MALSLTNFSVLCFLIKVYILAVGVESDFLFLKVLFYFYVVVILYLKYQRNGNRERQGKSTLAH